MAKYIGNIPSVGEFKKLDSLTSTFNGSLTQFDLEYGSTSVSVGDASQLIVSLNGIIQEPLTAYTLAVGGSAIVFSSAPASTDTCHIILLGGVGGTSTVSDGAVTAAKLDAGLKDYLEETYSANGSQTTYTLTRAPIGTNDLMITIDGIVQPSTAYSVAGTTLTISPALPNGTDVRVVHMGVRAGFVVPSSSSITAAMFQDFTTDVKFNDNAKAVFGTGDDLQIYHDGSSSYISDVGDGNLKIKSNGVATQILDGSSLNLAVFNSGNGQAQLYNVNSGTSTIRLATTSTGIDVTGDYVNSGHLLHNNNSGLKIIGGGNATNAGSNLTLYGGSNSSAGTFRFRNGTATYLEVVGNGDISFYNAAGSAAKLFWDASAESLTIGEGDTTQQTLRVTGQHASALSTGFDNQVFKIANTSVSKLSAMDIIATNVNGNAGTVARLGAFNTSSSAYLGELTMSTRDGTGMVERMRISSSGTVLVGKTSEGTDTDGIELNRQDVIVATRNNDAPLILNRRTSEGDITVFRKDNASVGSIGIEGGDLTIGKAASGLQFRAIDPCIRPHNMSTNSPSDNAVDLGRVNTRFKDLYLSGGVYLGGTGSANKLDDYEEGGWTPGAKGASSSNVATVSSGTAGSYVKIGNQVTVNFIVVISSLGSATGPLQITGLPFTIADILVATGIEANGTAGYWSGFATGINNLVFTAEGNTNLMYAYGTTSGTQTSISNITIAQMGTAALRGSISYRTT